MRDFSYNILQKPNDISIAGQSNVRELINAINN